MMTGHFDILDPHTEISSSVFLCESGQAAFFHYVDRKTNYMDSGWTKHGGCPVLEGTKYIATQWIRHGVSDQDPWFTFTPTGDRDFSDPSENSG